MSETDDDTEQNSKFVGKDVLHHNRMVEEYECSFGLVELEKLNYGEVEYYFGEVGNFFEIEPEDLAELFSDKVLQPDLSDCTEEEIEEMRPMVPADLLVGIMEVSDVLGDVEMQQDGTAEVSLDEGNFRTRN